MYRVRNSGRMKRQAIPMYDGTGPYTFVNNENFRLRFLRCELFDVQKAVSRFVEYSTLSYELFGDIALKRPIRLGDLSKLEIKFVRQGFYQMLPYPDRAGRRVIFLLGGMGPKVDEFERVSCLSSTGVFYMSGVELLGFSHSGLHYRHNSDHSAHNEG